MTFATSAASLLALLAALAAGTLGLAARRERAAQAACPPGGQFVTLAGGPFAGTRVHLEVSGPGAATGGAAAGGAAAQEPVRDVVLIHGASGSLRDMTFRLAPRLAARYRVFALDRPGFGWSDPIAEPTLVRQAALLRAAAAAAGARDPIVLGHSYGGAVALAWALEAAQAPAPGRAVSGLVLLAAASQVWPGPPPRLYRLTAPAAGQALLVPLLTALAPAATVRAAVAAAFAPEAEPEGYAAHFCPEMTLRRGTMRVNARQRVDLKAQIAALAPRYGAITAPSVLLHGTEDDTVSLDLHARPTAAAIPGAVLHPLPGAGHMIQQTRVDEAVAAVDAVAARAAP